MRSTGRVEGWADELRWGIAQPFAGRTGADRRHRPLFCLCRLLHPRLLALAYKVEIRPYAPFFIGIQLRNDGLRNLLGEGEQLCSWNRVVCEYNLKQHRFITIPIGAQARR